MNRLIIVRRLLRQVRPLLGWMGLTILLGVLTIGSGLGLMTLSAYLISEAALHPSFAALAVAILGVRVIRGILRYRERIVSHETTFRLLTQLRVWFYPNKIEPDYVMERRRYVQPPLNGLAPWKERGALPV